MKEGWKVVKLGEVCEIKGGATPLRTKHEYWADGTIPWFTVDDIREQGRIISKTRKHITELGAQRLQIYPKDTILLCCTASVGEYAITKIETASNQQFNGLMIKDKNVLFPYYLFYYVATLRDILLKLSTKTTIDFVSLTKVSQIPIPFPPLPEQHRIVKKLDAAFEKIDAMKAKAEKNIENAKALFQQTLAEELEPKEGWVEKKFGEVCRYYKEQGKYVDMKYIGMEHIESCTGRLLGSMDSNAVLSSSFKFNKGHVLYGRLRPYLKKVYVAEFDGCCSTEIFPIYSDMVYTGFIKYWLLTDWITNLINQTSAGCRMPRGNMEQVKTFLFSFPQDKEIQQQIVTKLDNLSAKCKKLEEAERKTIAECDALKQAILRQAFNGEL